MTHHPYWQSLAIALVIRLFWSNQQEIERSNVSGSCDNLNRQPVDNRQPSNDSRQAALQSTDTGWRLNTDALCLDTRRLNRCITLCDFWGSSDCIACRHFAKFLSHSIVRSLIAHFCRNLRHYWRWRSCVVHFKDIVVDSSKNGKERHT